MNAASLRRRVEPIQMDFKIKGGMPVKPVSMNLTIGKAFERNPAFVPLLPKVLNSFGYMEQRTTTDFISWADITTTTSYSKIVRELGSGNILTDFGSIEHYAPKIRKKWPSIPMLKKKHNIFFCLSQHSVITVVDVIMCDGRWVIYIPDTLWDSRIVLVGTRIFFTGKVMTFEAGLGQFAG